MEIINHRLVKLLDIGCISVTSSDLQRQFEMKQKSYSNFHINNQQVSVRLSIPFPRKLNITVRRFFVKFSSNYSDSGLYVCRYSLTGIESTVSCSISCFVQFANILRNNVK